tara:strand:+ start:284 stop:691 length:408 start_codon:yes stop_codon:yes gene_type:complete
MFAFVFLLIGLFFGWLVGTFMGYHWRVKGLETVRAYHDRRAELIAQAEEMFRIGCDKLEKQSQRKIYRLIKEYSESIIDGSTLRVVKAARDFVISTSLIDRPKLESALVQAVRGHAANGSPNLKMLKAAPTRDVN